MYIFVSHKMNSGYNDISSSTFDLFLSKEIDKECLQKERESIVDAVIIKL